ncbi:hypothetical protein GGX14DRAFT_696414 [Mycena pura]|uniref:DUF6534 domain-containing protein n=1 Tax=Mycena pura TaxID=153505 RepID=A0AAD6VKX7_9AGAR|nr:hypothetical protein GGX14DRAFT_696414 [Mycena pura]
MSSSQGIPPLDDTLGAIIIGAVVGTFLFGIMTLQMFSYYRRYPDDTLALKMLVGAVWLAELGHSISLWHALYQITITFYGQLPHILDPPNSMPFTLQFASLINLMVQTFFAIRIHALSKRLLIPIISSLLTVTRFAFNIVMLVEFLGSDGFAVMETKLRWVMLCVSVIGPAVDVLTASALIFYLWRMRSETLLLQRTRRTIDTLILWSLETTSVTCATGILQLIFFISMDNLVWMTFFLLQPKLFSNSLLAHLNGRTRFRTGDGVQNLATTVTASATGAERMDTAMDFRSGASRHVLAPEVYAFSQDKEKSRAVPF